MKLRRFTKAIGDTVMSSAFKERRRTPRWAVGRIAMILSEVGAAPRYCLVIDQSDGGVRIRTTPDFEVPSEFTLHCGDISRSKAGSAGERTFASPHAVHQADFQNLYLSANNRAKQK